MSFDLARAAPWASVPLRLVFGLGFLVHGSQKLFAAFGGPGMAGTVQGFRSLGIPEPGLMAWVVALVELSGGLLLLAGLATRLTAAVLTFDMIVGVLVAHLPRGFAGVEVPLAYLAGMLALVLLGGGALSVDAALPRPGLVPRLARPRPA